MLDNEKSVEEEIKKLGGSRRGEFGELILHLLLRDFKNTIPLISKVYFKDSIGNLTRYILLQMMVFYGWGKANFILIVNEELEN
ncbi:Hachiman antiphage defense system protein HamA [Acutalibacter sp. 1XD8-33]|uniref:Hachiman antiphage defense system protein HamA n=1 Tax=Acutalibacter sp. 1XD8-33 TaxID=2320081 RepID=UPI002ED50B14